MRPDPASQPSFDIAYLLAEIEDLKWLAKSMGYGTLDYLLEMAAIEAKHQVRLQRDGELAPKDPRHGRRELPDR